MKNSDKTTRLTPDELRRELGCIHVRSNDYAAQLLFEHADTLIDALAQVEALSRKVEIAVAALQTIADFKPKEGQQRVGIIRYERCPEIARIALKALREQS